MAISSKLSPEEVKLTEKIKNCQAQATLLKELLTDLLRKLEIESSKSAPAASDLNGAKLSEKIRGLPQTPLERLHKKCNILSEIIREFDARESDLSGQLSKLFLENRLGKKSQNGHRKAPPQKSAPFKK